MTRDNEHVDKRLDHSDRDDELAALVADYMDRLHDGERVRREDVLRDHPELGPQIMDELRFYIELESSGALDDARLGTLGDYTLRRQIGRGGMGVVYEAWEGSMDRVVALKVLPPGVAADDRAFQRFLQEAKTAGKLSHQNIVPIYSTGVKEGTPWFSMEFVEGETLSQILGRLRSVAGSGATRESRELSGLIELLEICVWPQVRRTPAVGRHRPF